MKDITWRTLILSVVIPIVIVGLSMWRTYSTMDLVYAKQKEVWELKVITVKQAKDYEFIKEILKRIEAQLSENKDKLDKLTP